MSNTSDNNFQTSVLFTILLTALCAGLLTLLGVLLHFSNFIVVFGIIALAIISIYKPNYPLYLLALMLPFFGNNPGGKYSLMTVDMVLILILLRWFVPLIFKKKRRILTSCLDVWIGLFLFLTLLSLFQLRHDLWNAYLWSGTSLWFVYRIYTAYAVDFFWSIRLLLNLVIGILFYYYVLNNVEQEEQIKKIGFAALGGLIISIIAGILDFHKIIDLTFFRPLNPDIERFGYSRLMSLFWHSDWFMEYMLPIAPFFLLPLFLGSAKSKMKTLILAILILYSTIFTYQRAAWISFGVMVLAMIFLVKKTLFSRLARRRSIIIFLAAILFLSVFFAIILFANSNLRISLANRFSELFLFSDRTRIWDQGLSLWSKKPLFGVGAGNYYYYHRTTYQPDHPFYNFDKVTAHNTYLHILVERGVFALLAFLLLLLYSLKKSLKTFTRCQPNSLERTIAGGCAVALIIFIIYGLAQYMFYIRIVEIIFWFVLGLSAFTGTKCLEQKQITAREKCCLAGFGAGAFILMLIFQPTAKDLFYWSEYSNPDVRFMASWFDPWDERTIECREEVLETRFVVFHPDTAQKPVRVDMLINGKVLASMPCRDKEPHEIAAFIPPQSKQPLHVKLLADRPFKGIEVYPETGVRAPFHCIVERDFRCRPLGLKGIGFSKWEDLNGIGFRWTNAPEAFCDVAVSSPVLALQLTASNPDLSANPLTVNIELSDSAGGTIAKRELTFANQQEIKTVRFNIPFPAVKTARLSIKVDRMFCPLDSGGNDSRILGIYVSEPLWEDKAGGK